MDQAEMTKRMESMGRSDTSKQTEWTGTNEHTDTTKESSEKIKVIHVIGGGEFGGAEQHIIQLLSLLHTEGVQGKVVCFYEAGLSQALRERGIDVEVLKYGRFDVRITSGLRKVFEREQPDIIHTHGVKANFFARIAARKMEHIPLVTTVHSILRFDYENRLAYSFVRLMENSTRRYNSHFIAVSNALRRSLIDEGVPPELVTAVHHGIDVAAFAPATTPEHAAQREQLRAEWRVPNDAYAIGVVGRLVRIKGVDFMIRALPAILKAKPHAHLVIIGSGPEEAALKQLAAQLGLTRHITFAGFRTDIAQCMRALDCFASASLSEGLGLNVLEAMSSELPAVVTGVGGILDFTEHEVNGLIVPTRSSDALAEAIIRLMDQPELAAQLARRARERVVSEFSLDSMAHRTADMYRNLLRIARMTREAANSPHAKKLVISGYYGYGNSGDEAVLYAILQALRQAGDKHGVKIVPTVLSVNPRATEQMHGVRAISRMNMLGIARELKRSDGLVSGGGSLLQDSTGRMTIPYYLSIIKFAQWFGKPTFIYAQGVGPIETKSFYPFIKYIYNRSQYISVRDQESGELLREIGVDMDRVDIVSDPVMGLAVTDLGRILQRSNAADVQDERGTVVNISDVNGVSSVTSATPADPDEVMSPTTQIGQAASGKVVNLADVAAPRGGGSALQADLESGGTLPHLADLATPSVESSSVHAVSDQPDQTDERPKVIGISVRYWHPYREELNRLAQALNEILDTDKQVILRFLPFYPPNDVEASLHVMDRLDSRHAHRIQIHTEAIHPQQMLEEVAACDLLIGMRLHSLIYAAAYGVPLLGISYDPKNDHFLHQLGMEAVASTDELHPHTVAQEALRLLRHRDEWLMETYSYIADLKHKSLKPAQQISAYLRK